MEFNLGFPKHGEPGALKQRGRKVMRFGFWFFQSGCIGEEWAGEHWYRETPVHSCSHASEFPISLCSAKRVDFTCMLFFLFNFFRADVKHNLCGLGWGKSQIMVSSLWFQGYHGSAGRAWRKCLGVEEVMPRGPGCKLVDLGWQAWSQPLDLMGPKPFLPTCS